MTVVSALRWFLARRYQQASPWHIEDGKWGTAFALGAGLGGIGWGAAGIVLYPEAYLTNQIFLVFVLGGMMLGAASLLAPRPEAFLAFLIPAGLAPAIRLLLQRDQTHLAMGLLALVFTIVSLITTWRIHLTVKGSLELQFENQDLVKDLRAANHETEVLNQALEVRVLERTAELHESTEQLKAEIVRRERMEDDLLRAQKLESLGVMAGGIAHDFNNFLTVVQGNLELAKARLSQENPLQEILNQTAKACQRAVFLSSQLLTFAKGGDPVRRVVSVANLLMDAVQLARAGAPVSIDTSIAEGLRCASVDPNQIGQVLHNILLNAREAMPEMGIIEVRADNAQNESGDPCVRISVQDYGCGIPTDVLPRVFDPYFTTKPRGSGLGLATAYSIIIKHGGHISVESKAGEGTLFVIDLPATNEVPNPEGPVPTAAQTGGERLLVMDDDDALRRLLEAILTSFGYVVKTARDGAEAIALYEDAETAGKGFDAVLLDLTVSGGMGGVEAAAKLKTKYPASKLIVSSGYSDAAVMSDFASYSFDAMIPKPWKAEEVNEVFRRVLAGKPAQKLD